MIKYIDLGLITLTIIDLKQIIRYYDNDNVSLTDLYFFFLTNATDSLNTFNLGDNNQHYDIMNKTLESGKYQYQ